MNETEKTWLAELTSDRMESAATLEKPSMRGIQRSVVDKYSDQAHFIYELLQNADDVKSTSVQFILETNGLYFVHNGTVRFTISDPQTEDCDSSEGTLGHINSITSIANSNKTDASIGKFGVGFKSVFQYTQTPHIYDPSIQFKIERFIVPHFIEQDLSWRQEFDTVFWFPFNHKMKPPGECYEDILEKLRTLEFPLLFLSNLQSINFKAAAISGKYQKTTASEYEYEDVKVQRIELLLEQNNTQTTQKLITFSKANENQLPYYIAYALNEEERLAPITRPAFCFFPTKEATNLNFIVHAPFLLTDSREGIKAGEKHNQTLIRLLADLASASLPALRHAKLIDDSIFDIVPYDERKFNEHDDRKKLSFKPFFDSIYSRLKYDALLPAEDGKCSPREISYWASDTELVELFTDEQLAQLMSKARASWIYRSRGKKDVQYGNRTLAEYIDGGDLRSKQRKEPNLIAASLDPETALKRITAEFIASQPLDWLHQLYAYLSERASYQQFVKDKPIFLDQLGKPAAAFDSDGQLILFLPDSSLEGYAKISSCLLSCDSTNAFVAKFGISYPSLRDDIYNRVLPEYESEEEIDAIQHFTKFFRYFKDCRNEEVADFLQLIKDKAFLLCTTASTTNAFRAKASEIYIPSSDLKAWFKPKQTTRFLLIATYLELYPESEHDSLYLFLQRLGVASLPRVIKNNSPLGWNQLRDLGLTLDGRDHLLTNNSLDGCEKLVAEINTERSVLLWKLLPKFIDELKGAHTWFHYSKKHEHVESRIEKRLRTGSWILNKSGELVSADAVTPDTLSDLYQLTTKETSELVKFLGISEKEVPSSVLSDDEIRMLRLADEIERSGLSEKEIFAAIEEAMRRKSESLLLITNTKLVEEIDPAPSIIMEIESRRASGKSNQSNSVPGAPKAKPVCEDEDTDDYIPKTLDYGRIIERAKDRLAVDIDRIEREQELQERVCDLPRYSYGWFLALLELECMAGVEKYSDSKGISISFGKIEQDKNSPRTVVFKQPSRFIPQSIEELSGVRVDLDFGNGRTGKMRVDSFTVKEFSVSGRLDTGVKLKEFEFCDVKEARIVVQNPTFLMRELLERYRELAFAEGVDLKAKLPTNIEFVFGPPGTGKTTHLVKNLLIPEMAETQGARVLVLAPTNKAADVLTNRILEVMGNDKTYLNWLVRFGTSSDERLEKAGVWRDRSFVLSSLSRSITVTTVARLAYDGFAGEHGRRLYEYEWDLVVFDEASMISLANIIFPLYRLQPRRFLIAGDPFQIEPIVTVEQWKDENIFTLVGLNKTGSFATPQTEPHSFPIKNLETQYRSVPAIGEVFSRFTYDGILKHNRDKNTPYRVVINGSEASPLNIVRFPVSKYESIYRSKRLESGTPYHAYSALLTFEFSRWLSLNVQMDVSRVFRIGVIAPYRAQANLLSRLNDSWVGRPKGIEIQVGTIHGFQGDECDAIIAVMNPPPTISKSPNMFLNKQNILNVAISRARDYLFLILPDCNTEGYADLHRITKMVDLVKSGHAYSEFESYVIENMIFRNPKFLEENTYSTGHQMVNVYLTPERLYEVRSDESAIDVQIREEPERSTIHN